MEKGIQKLLRKLFLKKYPMYLDIHVQVGSNNHPYAHLRHCFDVFLIILDEDFREDEDMHLEVKKYIFSLAKFLDERICGVYNEKVTKEEWEEWKLGEKD